MRVTHRQLFCQKPQQFYYNYDKEGKMKNYYLHFLKHSSRLEEDPWIFKISSKTFER